MTNLATLNLTDAQLTAIDSAITQLETQLSGMVALSTADKRRAAKLGEKSEYFCRQTLRMLAENPQVIPPNLDLADAIADLDARDALRPRLMRLTRLLERGNVAVRPPPSMRGRLDSARRRSPASSSATGFRCPD